MLTMGLIATACGGSNGGEESGNTGIGDGDEQTATTGATEAGAQSDFQLDEPVHVVALIGDPQIAPDDPNAVPDFNDGIRMAVQEINANGGIGGHDVEFTPIPTGAYGDTVINSLNTGLEEDPTVLVGPVSSTALLTIAGRIGQAGVPTLHATTDPQATRDGEAGNEWIFGMRTLNDKAASVAAQYAVEELGAEQLGQLYVDVAFGQSGAAAQEETAQELGAEIAAERGFAFDVTDLTEEVLAMEGVDAILDWGTPNTLALAVTTLAQQGLGDIPHIGPGSVGFSTFPQAVGDDSLLEGLLGTVDCNPSDDEREQTQQWAQRFEEQFGYRPGYGSAQMYDSVKIIEHVVNEAESASPTTIRDGLEDLAWSDGVCAREYRNENGILMHETTMVRFEDGRPMTQQVYEDLG